MIPELRDIMVPEAGGFWPPAPGWWLLALIVALAMGVASWHLFRLMQSNSRRRAMISQLEQIETCDWERLGVFARRLARSQGLSENIDGIAWEEHLALWDPGNVAAPHLARAAYQPQPAECWDEAVRLLRAGIRQC